MDHSLKEPMDDHSRHKVATASNDLPILQKTIRNVSLLESDNWADSLPSTDHVRFFRSIDWAATHLGPLNRFSTALRLHTFTVFADSRAACLYWLVFFQSKDYVIV
jgi:hypothetical protein